MKRLGLILFLLILVFYASGQAPAKVDSLEKLLLDHPQEDST